MRQLNKKQIKHRFQITDLLVKYVNFSGYLQSVITSLNFTKHQNKQTLTILLSYRANNRIEHNVDMCPVVVDCSKTVNFFTRCCNNGIDLRCIKPLRNICKVVRHRIKLNKSYRNEQGCTIILHKLCHLMYSWNYIGKIIAYSYIAIEGKKLPDLRCARCPIRKKYNKC